MTESALRELLEQQIAGLKEATGTRFETLERALKAQAEVRKDRVAFWMATVSLAVAVLTFLAVLPKWGA